MISVKVNVLRILDVSNPGFVEFELIDCEGSSHHFIDKIPVVCEDYEITLPCTGYMRCNIIEERESTYIIDTQSPDDIESTKGEYKFEVNKNQIRSI